MTGFRMIENVVEWCKNRQKNGIENKKRVLLPEIMLYEMKGRITVCRHKNGRQCGREAG